MVQSLPRMLGTKHASVCWKSSKQLFQRSKISMVIQPNLSINFELTLTHIQMVSEASATYNFFKEIMAKGEIAHGEQFLLLTQCYQSYTIILLSLKENFHTFDLILISV